MAAIDYEARLVLVQAAIAAIEGGAQSYSISTGAGGGRSLTRANLSELYAQEKYLIAKIERVAAGGTGGMRARFGTPV